MKILVTAGNTQVLIDRVRCLTNIFTGQTGAQIAAHAAHAGHSIRLLTSHPETAPAQARLDVQKYRTFEELSVELEAAIHSGQFDAVVQCAAISDYLAGGVFSPEPHTRFDPDSGVWSSLGGTPRLLDRAAGKVKSDEPELWLRLVRAPKLIDRIREPWGFRGVLVKFKLEVGLTESALQEVAERSRRHSQADLMVANTLEGAGEWALLGLPNGAYERISRAALPARLLPEIERLHEERIDG